MNTENSSKVNFASSSSERAEKKSRIVILGAGESGAGAAVLAKVKGFDTFVSDMSAIKDNYK